MTDAADWNSFLLTFHKRFPSHVGIRRRRQMFALALKLLAEDVPPDQAEAFIDNEVKARVLDAADKAIVMFLVFIAMLAWTMLMEPRLDKASIENPEAKQRFFATLFDELDQALDRKPAAEDVWPFPGSLFEQTEPAVPLQKSQPQSPKRSQAGTSGAPKSVRRKPASQSKKKTEKKRP